MAGMDVLKENVFGMKNCLGTCATVLFVYKMMHGGRRQNVNDKDIGNADRKRTLI
jgi:hypothetical protein